MEKDRIPFELREKAWSLDEVTGKPLKTIQIYQSDDALNLDIYFQDETMLELIVRVGFQATTTLLEDRGGELRVVNRIGPRVVSSE